MKKLTNEIVDERLIGRNIQRLENVKGATTKIKWKCLKDGYEWETTIDSVTIAKHGCPKCAKNKILTNEEVDQRLIGRNIQRLENVKGATTKIKWKCLKDGYEWETVPNVVLNLKSNCPRCSNVERHTNENIDERLVGRNIQRLENVKGGHSKIKWKCLKDGYEWETEPSNILSGKGCPKCKRSKGEELIMKILDKNNIKYTKEKRFKECKYKKPLPFDFYIEETNILIEYQGEQHFRPVSFGSKDKIKAEERFKERLIKDQIKKEWALKNGYDLIYFTYKDTEQEIIDKLSFTVAFA